MWEGGMLLTPVREHGDAKSLVLVFCSFDPDNFPHMPYSMSFLALGNHKDMLTASNALVAAQLPAVASLEHLLVNDFPGVVWTASACCPNCLLSEPLETLEVVLARGLRAQFPLGTLTDKAYASCDKCRTSTCTLPLLLNFLENKDDPRQTYLFITVQKLIEGLGSIIVRKFADVVVQSESFSTDDADGAEDDWEVLNMPKTQPVSLKSPVNATFDTESDVFALQRAMNALRQQTQAHAQTNTAVAAVGPGVAGKQTGTDSSEGAKPESDC